MNRLAARLGPFTITGAIVAVLGIGCYVAGWQLGWIELMVVAAGCLAALAIAVAFVVGRLAIQIDRDVDPDRVMVGEPAGALLTARNPGRRPTRSIVVDEHIGPNIVPVSVPTLAPGGEHRTFYQLPTNRRSRAAHRPRRSRPRRSARPAPPTGRPCPGDRPLGAPPMVAGVGAAERLRQGSRGPHQRRLAVR